ncbi:MAG: hypothetical protein RLZZ347_239 [Candidatus Parcubacteria bacterium]|jgi:hypothetical protein
MVRTLRSVITAGEDIKGLPPGSVIEIQGEHSLWDYLFADGDSFWLGYENNHFITLKRPVVPSDPARILDASKISRLIPHPDGPIVMDLDGDLTQNNKPFCHQFTPGLQSIPCISKGSNGLSVFFACGSASVNLTAVVPWLTDYDELEQHRLGLLIRRGNSVWLVTPGPKVILDTPEPAKKQEPTEVVEG